MCCCRVLSRGGVEWWMGCTHLSSDSTTGQWIRTLDWARVFGMPLKEAARIAADGLQYLQVGRLSPCLGFSTCPVGMPESEEELQSQFFHDIHVHKNAILPANMSSLAQTGLAMRIRYVSSVLSSLLQCCRGG